MGKRRQKKPSNRKPHPRGRRRNKRARQLHPAQAAARARRDAQRPPAEPEPDLVDDFIREVAPANPELCERELRVMLRYARSLEAAPEPRHWIGSGSMDVYTQVYMRGSGLGHALQVLRRFFRWMAASGRLDPWDAGTYLVECELVRRSYGMSPTTVRLPEVEGVPSAKVATWFATEYERPRIERYVAEMPEQEAEAATTAVELALVWFAERFGAPVAWGRFDPEAYVADLVESAALTAADCPPEEVREFHTYLLSELARYFRALSPKKVSPELAERVEHLALALGCGAAA